MISLPSQDQMPVNDPLLSRVAANVRRYEQTLPTLATDESIHSELQQGIFRRSRANATATIYVTHRDGKLEDVRSYLSINGQATRGGGRQRVPYEYTGGFSAPLLILFAEHRLACYDFIPAPKPDRDGLLHYEVAARISADASCRINGTVPHGSAEIDPRIGEVRQVEIDFVRPEGGSTHPWTSSVQCAYAPASIAGETFWLPIVVTARLGDGKGVFVARYSGYHRYVGSITMLP